MTELWVFGYGSLKWSPGFEFVEQASAALLKLFTRTRAIRRGVIEAGQDTSTADFGRPHGHED